MSVAQHPLEPLAADEFRRTVGVLRREGRVTDAWRFASISLVEPAKAQMKSWKPGAHLPRHVLAVVWSREDNQTYEAVVDLDNELVASWTHVPGAVPNFTVDELYECDETMRSHPEVIAALAKRGITDLSLVLVDVWTYGKGLIPEQWRGRRVGWGGLWVRDQPGGNPFAHPVSGLKLVVDVNRMELLQIEEETDHGRPEVRGEYVPGPWTGEQRTDLKPLQVTQPQGPSFTVEGTQLTWQNWS